MKIVINSHKQNSLARTHLLESMEMKKEFLSFEIIMVIGGCKDNYEINKIGNITYIKCNHNSIDFTGLITLLELYSANINEHYFYMHDTCKIGDGFYGKLGKINLTNVSSIKMNERFSMNMGIYSQKIINKSKDFLLKMKNVDENKCMDYKILCVKNEDYIFKNDRNNYSFENYNGWCYTPPRDYYGTGVQRIVEHYPNFDIYKIKANWGQSENFTLQL